MIRVMLVTLATLGAASAAAQDTADVIIRGGIVHDGGGAPGRVADVAIRGDRIVLVGDASGWRSARFIDARGLAVAPGFIDPHVHAMGDLTSRNRATRQAPFALMQGVTTVVTGNDGQGTPDVDAMLAAFTRDSIGVNAALLVGHGSVRGRVMNAAARAPTGGELDSMKVLVDGAMRAGAFGMSSGLYYAPGSFAETREVVELARVVASHGGVYDTHMRDESSYTIGLLASVKEAIEIGRQSGLPVNISHIKALGVDVWGRAAEVIALIRAARAAGVVVTADQYPWTASGTSLAAALLPRWAEGGGADSLRMRLANPGVRRRIITEMRENLRRRGGAEALRITSASGRANEGIAGRTLAQVASAAGLDPVATAVRVIERGGASVASFNMQESDIEAFMREPFVMTGSDGSGGHPRKYATYPRKVRHYVLDRGVISMERMIQASSAQVADAFRIAGRGWLREGHFADVIVFDPETFGAEATYDHPDRLATGMRWVFVNGVAAVVDGRMTESLGGRGLSRAKQGAYVRPMTHRATGSFDVKLAPLAPHHTGGSALGRMSIDKTFRGDLDATSAGEMLAGMTAVANSAGYVAMERVTGTLGGRRGTFLLQHTGVMNRGTPSLTITVIPDSGTGDLAGLTGTMQIVMDGKDHSYIFEYSLGT